MILLPYTWIETMRAYWFLLSEGIAVKIISNKEGCLEVVLHSWIGVFDVK